MTFVDAQLGLGVCQDPSMVKCEVNVAHIDPFGFDRIRPHAWPSLVREFGHECHTNNMASRVAIDVRVDSDEDEFGDVDSGLLPDFATAGGHDSFADLHETWKRPRPMLPPLARAAESGVEETVFLYRSVLI